MCPLNVSGNSWSFCEFVLDVFHKELMFEGNCDRKVLVEHLISFIPISPCGKFDHPSALLVPFGSSTPFHWRYCRWMSQVTSFFGKK